MGERLMLNLPHNLDPILHVSLNTRLLTCYVLCRLVQVRKVDMLEGVSVIRSEKVKDELVLDGNDIELVSRSAALINQVSPFSLFLFPPVCKVKIPVLHYKPLLILLCLIYCYRNVMLRKKTSGSSLTVSTSATREQWPMRSNFSSICTVVLGFCDYFLQGWGAQQFLSIYPHGSFFPFIF